MKVFKFGGASVNSAEAIRNVARIVQRHKNESLVVVVSAMGKMTNYFELLNSYYIEKSDQLSSQLKSIRKFHEEVLDQLIESEDNRAHKILDHIFVDLQLFLDTNSSESYDLIYDRIVGYGEMLSTTIIYSFLEQEGLNVKWIDAKDLIKTDEHHREANVLWDETKEKIKEQLRMDDSGHPIYITQGFISATMEGVATTLGREGSDYTASIFANILDAEEVIIWKDVPGIMSADPKIFPDAIKIEEISFYDAIEMTYYGAKILHPKTLKPLYDKEIPLKVRSFLDPEKEGTIVRRMKKDPGLPPIRIIKTDQVLISVISKDFSFITEQNLSLIYATFAEADVKLNMLQNAAISFTVSIDNDPGKVDALVETLKNNFRVLINDDLELITIRHYDDATVDQMIKGREVILEQKTRHTIQYLVK